MTAITRLALARNLAIAAVAGLALWLITNAASPYSNLQIATMAYYFVAVAGLTVLTGQNGQVSLGHGALMAVGACHREAQRRAPHAPGRSAVVLALAALVTAVFGLLAGAAAARLRGPSWPGRRWQRGRLIPPSRHASRAFSAATTG